MERNLFEIATRKKYRFQAGKGNYSVEDLWDLNLEELDGLYKGYCKQLREAQDDTLLAPTDNSKKNREVADKRGIVALVVRHKQVAAEARATQRERKAKMERIKELIHKKEEAALEEKTAAELETLLQQVDASDTVFED